jgi:hypothetical protein
MFEDVTDPEKKSIWRYGHWWRIPPVDSDEASQLVRWTCVFLSAFLSVHLWTMWRRLTAPEIGLGVSAILLLALVWITRNDLLVLVLVAETLSFAVVTFQARFAAAWSSRDDFHALELAVVVPIVALFWLRPRCLDYYRLRQAERQKLPQVPEA